MSRPVWLITGPNGLGLALVLRVLRAGHKVVGTVRNKSKAAAAVEQIEKAGGSVIEMDMTEPKSSITSKVQAKSDNEVTLQINTNFFGPLYTLQAALPGMRSRKSGIIVNVFIVAASHPLAACSLYAASKAALGAASESLAKEVAPHNIRVLIVEPGNFRTNFVSAIGDREKAVERIFEAVIGEGLAGHLTGNDLRLVLGKDALNRIKVRNDKFLHELSLQEETATSTEFTS